MKKFLFTLASILLTITVHSSFADNATIGKKDAVLLYAVNSGNWNNPGIWSTDPDIHTNPDNAIPDSQTDIFVKSGITVYVSTDVTNLSINDAVINGRLTVAKKGLTCNNLSGQGTIELSVDGYPSVSGSDLFKSDNLSTVEISSNSDFAFTSAPVVNNLNISMISADNKVIITNNVVVNKNLRISTGKLTFGGNSEDITLLIKGNLTLINSYSSIVNDNVGKRRVIDLYGNIDNNGGVMKFTSLTDYSSSVPADSYIELRFSGNKQNQTVECDGYMTLYRIIVNKGTSKVYSVAINASDSKYFKILGDASKSTQGLTADYCFNSANKNNIPQVVLLNGTLIVGSLININNLTQNVFDINANSCLKIAGGSATATSNSTVFNVEGALEISGGTLNILSANGLKLYGSGSLTIKGGTVNATDKSVAVADGTANTGVFNQSAGTLNAGSFVMNNSASVFSMSGGNINVSQSWKVISSELNCSVTGGNVVFNNANFNVEAVNPFWNLTLKGSGNIYNQYRYKFDSRNTDKINVLNNFIFEDASYLMLQNNVKNIYVGGNLTIGQKVWLENTPNLIFNGSKNSAFTVNTSSLTFGSILTDKSADSYGVTLTGNNITANSDFTLNKGAFTATGLTVIVCGNASANNVFTGTLNMKGYSGKELKCGTQGNLGDIVAYCELQLKSDCRANSYKFNTDNQCLLNGYTMTIDSQVTGYGTLSETLNSREETATTNKRYFANNTNVTTGGLRMHVIINAGANGLIKEFPIGISTGMSWAKIYASGTSSASDDYVTINPIGTTHPKISESNSNLDMYWKITSTNNCTSYGSVFYRFHTVEPFFPGVGLFSDSQKSVGIFEGESDFIESSTTFGNLSSIFGKVKHYMFDFKNSNYALTSGDFTVVNNGSFINNGSSSGNVWIANKSGKFNKDKIWQKFNATTLQGEGDFYAGDSIGANDACMINKSIEVTVDRKSDIGTLVMLDSTSVLNFPYQYTGWNVNTLSGMGTLKLVGDVNNNFPVFSSSTDYSSFDADLGSVYLFYIYSDNKWWATINYNHSGNYPNVSFDVQGGTINTAFEYQYSTKLNVNGYIQLNGDVPMRMSEDVVCGQLRIGGNKGAVLKFSKDYYKTFTVKGDLTFDYGTDKGSNRYITITDGDGNNGREIPHNKLIVYGDILCKDAANANVSGILGFKTQGVPQNSNMQGDFIKIELAGNTDNGFYCACPEKFTFDADYLLVNKAVGNSFTVNDKAINFASGRSANELDTMKNIYMKSGELILNAPDQIVNLSTGGADYTINSSSVITAQNNTVLNISGCKNIYLGGVINAKENSSLNFGGKLYYTATGKSAVNIYDNASFFASQICEKSGTSGSINFNILSKTAVVEFGQKNFTCGLESGRGIFDLSATSVLKMEKDASLVIAAHGNDEVADCYIKSDKIDLATGSTITFGQDADNSDYFVLQSLQPLVNVTVNNASKLTLKEVKLDLKGNLTINPDAEFVSNGFDVTIYGNMTAQGLYTHNNNNLYFVGGAPSEITGNVDFYNLYIKKSNTQTICKSNISVDNLLEIDNGVLTENGSYIKVDGTYKNHSEYLYSGTGKGIWINGTEIQTLESSGTNGKITIDNAKGAKVETTIEDFVITRCLALENGVLNMGQNSLKLTADAIFENSSNTYSLNNMLSFADGYSANGVTKIFKGSETSFLFPIGASGKYTPLTMEINSLNSGAELTILPVNGINGSVVDDNDELYLFDDTKNALQYYWTLIATGVDGFTGKIKMQHADGDNPAGEGIAANGDKITYTTDDYIPARLLVSDNLWNKYDKTFYTPNVLTFEFYNNNDNEITGYYTAGVSQENGKGAIPDFVMEYTTIADGDWNNPLIWETVPAGGDIPGNGPLSGSIIHVKHNVNLTQDGIRNFKTVIDSISGVINIGNTYNHGFGIVSGIGSISSVNNGTLPNGKYTDFVSEQGGTFVFDGNLSYTVLNNFTEVNNVMIKGEGVKTFPGNNLVINGTLTLENQTSVKNAGDYAWYIKGNLINNGAKLDAGYGYDNARIVLCGSKTQYITGTSAFTGANNSSLYQLDINNCKGVVVETDVDISKKLTFIKGIIYNNDKKLTLVKTGTTVEGAGSESFVDGPTTKLLGNGGSFDFPVGNDSRYGKFSLVNVTCDGTDYFTARYYNKAFADIESCDNGLYINNNEYWSAVATKDNSEALGVVRWDDVSGVSSDINARKNLRQVVWTGTKWTVNGSDINDLGNTEGYITADESINIKSEKYFTLSSNTTFTYYWTGVVSSDWFNAANWNNNTVPSSMDEVIINNSTNFQPIVEPGDKIAYTGNLTISDGSSLTVNPGGKLTAYGDTKIDNATGGNLILASDANDVISLSGSFIDNGNVEGNIKVYRSIPKNRWTRIAPPINSALSTIFTASRPGAYNSNFYSYDETFDLDSNAATAPVPGDVSRQLADGWANYTNGRWGAGKTLIPGSGYDFYSFVNFSALFYGKPNTGDLTLPLSLTNNDKYSDADPYIFDGWHCIGNPYTSSLDWNVVEDNMVGTDKVLYIYDYTNKIYMSYVNGISNNGCSGYVAPMQGFFVHALQSNASVTITKDARRHADGNTHFNSKTSDSESQDLFMRIAADISGANGKTTDETVIYFNQNGTDNFDNGFDALKMLSPGSAINIYTKNSLNDNIAINCMSSGNIETKEVPLCYNANSAGTYIFNFKAFNFNGVNVYLKDNTLNTYERISQGKTVTFKSEIGTFGNRFVIVFKKNNAPQVISKLENQEVLQDSKLEYTLPETVFEEKDFNDNVAGYEVSLQNGEVLPAWITYDYATRTFSGTPSGTDVKNYTIAVTAWDNMNARNSALFNINVINVNDAPSSTTIPDIQLFEDQYYTIDFSQFYSDIDSDDLLTYSMIDAPGFIDFDNNTGIAQILASNSAVGTYPIVITSKDLAGVTTSESFNLEIVNVNDAPYLNIEIGEVEITTGKFFYELPEGTFIDEDTDDELTYSYTTADGKELPSWLSYSSATGWISGKTDYSQTVQLLLTATDKQGAQSVACFDLIINLNDVEGDLTLVHSNDSNCKSFSEEEDLFSTGIDETSGSEIEVTAFPVPSKGNITINATDLINEYTVVDVKVVDVRGALVWHNSVSIPMFMIDLTGKAAGNYFVRLTAGNTVIIKKIIIE